MNGRYTYYWIKGKYGWFWNDEILKFTGFELEIKYNSY